MISIEETRNAAILKAILNEPELLDRITEDGLDEFPLFEEKIYLLLRTDDIPMGVFILDALNSTTVNVHCNILKKHRDESRQGAIAFYNWCVQHLPENYKKICAEISTAFPDVYKFTKSMGFVDEGVNRLSISKGGVLLDQNRLGITRTEIVNFLGEL